MKTLNPVIACAALLLLALLAFVVTPVPAQAPPPITRMVISPAAWGTLDSLARDAREKWAENAACLTRYTVRDSVLTVEGFGPATYVSSDSVTIRATQPICNFGVPSVHSHIAFGGWPEPSDTDKATARYRGIWNLLLSVRQNGWLLMAY